MIWLLSCRGRRQVESNLKVVVVYFIPSAGCWLFIILLLRLSCKKERMELGNQRSKDSQSDKMQTKVSPTEDIRSSKIFHFL